ncbi:hypothetical protein GGI00_001707 [Coemansia sp. RSA 2681]|nr:hypothetical protein GGI00_001707 [Coemansia sp. RSA 2681]
MPYDTHRACVEIYTDGACLSNGYPNARGGIGVYFDYNDPLNFSGPLIGGVHTNQRAELEAIYQALIQVKRFFRGRYRPTVLILTDSHYSVMCLTVWYKMWSQNGWRNKKGGQVSNMYLIQDILDLIEDLRCTVSFEHIPGHSKIPGNEAAHALASAGARM